MINNCNDTQIFNLLPSYKAIQSWYFKIEVALNMGSMNIISNYFWICFRYSSPPFCCSPASTRSGKSKCIPPQKIVFSCPASLTDPPQNRTHSTEKALPATTSCCSSLLALCCTYLGALLTSYFLSQPPSSYWAFANRVCLHRDCEASLSTSKFDCYSSCFRICNAPQPSSSQKQLALLRSFWEKSSILKVLCCCCSKIDSFLYWCKSGNW